MSDADALKAAFRGGTPAPLDKRAERRRKRADATRRQALSPVRILTSVLLVPVVTAGLTVSIYIRTSPFEREDALRHLIAMSGCSAAVKFGVAGATRGEPGYHERNDTNSDGVACAEDTVREMTGGMPAPQGAVRINGGAKFIRPE